LLLLLPAERKEEDFEREAREWGVVGTKKAWVEGRKQARRRTMMARTAKGRKMMSLGPGGRRR